MCLKIALKLRKVACWLDPAAVSVSCGVSMCLHRSLHLHSTLRLRQREDSLKMPSFVSWIRFIPLLLLPKAHLSNILGAWRYRVLVSVSCTGVPSGVDICVPAPPVDSNTSQLRPDGSYMWVQDSHECLQLHSESFCIILQEQWALKWEDRHSCLSGKCTVTSMLTVSSLLA